MFSPGEPYVTRDQRMEDIWDEQRALIAEEIAEFVETKFSVTLPKDVIEDFSQVIMENML